MALLNVFKAIDKEGNHRVSLGDLWEGLLEDGRLALVLKLPAEPTRDEVEARFLQLDTDENGYLTFDEFCAVLDLPEPVRHGLMRLAAHMYASRDSALSEPPAAVTALWRPYRRVRL